jgi:phosphopantothenoylcysteine decarboxylase/phosphopantothenate--cysteine ligase
MAAAVADYRPKTVADQKIKKTTDTLTIEMERTPDILASVARKKKPGQIVVGFAVETEAEKADKRALERLQKKSLDMIALNVIGEKGVGFGTDTNRVTLFCRDGSKSELPLMEKREIARIMWERIAALQGTGPQTKNQA